jgi:hypothetical protein
MDRKKSILVTALIAIVVVAIGGLAFYRNQTSTSPDTDEYVSSAAPTIKGEAACLPLKSGEEASPGANNCHVGLKNDKGLYLELQNMPQDKLKVGEQVEVKGTFTAAGEDTPYQTSGTIKVE